MVNTTKLNEVGKMQGIKNNRRKYIPTYSSLAVLRIPTNKSVSNITKVVALAANAKPVERRNLAKQHEINPTTKKKIKMIPRMLIAKPVI